MSEFHLTRIKHCLTKMYYYYRYYNDNDQNYPPAISLNSRTLQLSTSTSLTLSLWKQYYYRIYKHNHCLLNNIDGPTCHVRQVRSRRKKKYALVLKDLSSLYVLIY